MKQKIQNVGKFLRWTPWQVKLSMLVMGLGQLCYGQIVKGLFYLACFGLILTYFITTGFADFIGFFTLGTNEENLWLGIPGDNSLTMLILGLFSIFILIFTVVLYVTNVKDAVYTARQAEQGKSIHKFRQTLETAADDKFHLTALTAPEVGVSIFSILPIVQTIYAYSPAVSLTFLLSVMLFSIAEWALLTQVFRAKLIARYCAALLLLALCSGILALFLL